MELLKSQSFSSHQLGGPVDSLETFVLLRCHRNIDVAI